MRVGDVVEDFEATDETGTKIRFSDYLAKGPVALFFYPKAMTTGCTKESCHFRDLHGEFTALGAQPVGISPDPVPKQKDFATKHSFTYPLLSDEGGTVADQFGVRRKKITPVKRTTFVIGRDGRIIETIASELRMNLHADKALDVLKGQGGQ